MEVSVISALAEVGAGVAIKMKRPHPFLAFLRFATRLSLIDSQFPPNDNCTKECVRMLERSFEGVGK